MKHKKILISFIFSLLIVACFAVVASADTISDLTGTTWIFDASKSTNISSIFSSDSTIDFYCTGSISSSSYSLNFNSLRINNFSTWIFSQYSSFAQPPVLAFDIYSVSNYSYYQSSSSSTPVYFSNTPYYITFTSGSSLTSSSFIRCVQTAFTLYSPAPDTPSNVTFNSSTNTLSWDSVSDATSYIVEYSSTGNAADSSNVRTTVTGTSYSITQSGYYQVYSHNSDGTSDGSGFVSYTYTAAAPSGLSFDNLHTLSWTAYDSASSYTIDMSSDGSTVSQSSTSSTNSYSISTAAYYRVKAVGSWGTSFATSWVYCQPALASLTASVNSSGVLSWTSVPLATSYRVDISSDGSFVDSSTIVANGTSCSVSLGSYYRVTALRSGFTSSTSSWVSSSGVTLVTLSAPTVTLSGSNIVWTSVTNATGYEIYLDGTYLKSVDSSTLSYTPLSSGTYYVRAVGSGTVQPSTLAPSGGIVYTYTPYTAETEPTKPGDDASILDWVKYFIQYVQYLQNNLIRSVWTVISSAINSISSLVNYVTQFVSSIGDLFSFLPTEIRTLIYSTFSIFVVIAILKLFL